MMRGTRSTISGSSQVIILRQGRHTIGLLVDELHAVPQFHAAQIMHTPFSTRAESMLVTQVIKANNGQLLIQAIDVDRLFAWLVEGQLPVPPEVLQEITAAPQDVAKNQPLSLLAA